MKDLPSHLETTIGQPESYQTSLRFIKGAHRDMNPERFFFNILSPNFNIKKYFYFTSIGEKIMETSNENASSHLRAA